MTAPTTGSDPQAQRRAHEETHALDLATVERLLPGPAYRDVLAWIHKHGKPRNYLEIGVNLGLSFALVQPGTWAVGVDPEPRLTQRVTGAIAKQTSDAFFARPDLHKIIRPPVRFSFIDGLHTFDQVLRDFLNVEQVSAPDSLVVLHDVYPIHADAAERERRRIFWTGDVWKAAAILADERPDLSLTYVPAPPSGLLLVTDLDPAHTALRQRFDAVVEAWMNRPLPADMQDVVARFQRIANAEQAVSDYVSALWAGPATA